MRNAARHARQQMKYKLTIIFLLGILTSGCSPNAGPKIHYFEKDGVQWRTLKIYGYPDGKRKLAQVCTYRENWLQESIVYYELWPVGGWKFVSKDGFVTVKDGKYLLHNDSIIVPDNIIYTYFDKNFKEVIEVYKDGKRIPFTLGHYDGYESMQFLVDTPGVYKWKDGKEFFLRPFTEQEWESHRKVNEMLNNKLTTDTTKIK